MGQPTLVTGANGFLGRYIVDHLLARGDPVRAVCRRADPQLEQAGAVVCLADVRNRDGLLDAFRGIETVFHAAAIAGIWGPWKPYFDTNTLGTRNVIAACIENRVKRLVYTSSPSVTFDGKPQEGVNESAPYAQRWLCHYPHSKALAEQEVLSANGTEGLLTCSLRPHLIWGPRDSHLIPRLLARARSGRLRRIGDGNNLIDMIYVDNAATAHLQAADALEPQSPVAGKPFFISQGEPVNCWQWINEILGLAGMEPVTKSISLSAAWKIGGILETAYRALRLRGEPRMTRFLAAQLGTSHFFDIRRAREDFGYAPKVSTEKGMRRLAQSIRLDGS